MQTSPGQHAGLPSSPVIEMRGSPEALRQVSQQAGSRVVKLETRGRKQMEIGAVRSVMKDGEPGAWEPGRSKKPWSV